MKKVSLHLLVMPEEKEEMRKNATESGHQNITAYLLFLWRTDKKKIKNKC